MKKLYTLILSLFVINAVFSQLTVKPASSAKSSFIYVKEKVLFVHGPITLQKNTGNIETEASIYLREDAQLIQGSSGISQNTGNGLLSVFQEGTSNAYDYNYWAAPVGNDLPGNGFFGINLIYAPETETRSIRAGNMDVMDGSAYPLSISSRWIYTFAGTQYTDWKHVGNRTEISSGYGFTMKGVNGKDPLIVTGRQNNPGNGQRYDFRGKPNNGDIEIPVVAGARVLVGNPYPSALDLSLFLLENSGSGTMSSSCYDIISRKNTITGIAYYWDSQENGSSHYLNQYVGGYGAFAPVDPCTAGIYTKPVFKMHGVSEQPEDLPDSKHYERRFSPIGQGFMVEVASSSNISFKNSHRIFKKEGEFSDFKYPVKESKSQEKVELATIPELTFEATFNDHYIRQFSLAFWPTATPGADSGMDATAYETVPSDIGFLQNDKNYVIDIRPFSEIEEIPLFLKVERSEAKIEIKIADVKNFNSQNIFLLDSEKQIYYSIKEKAVILELDEGTYHGRFRISFQDKKEVPLKDQIVEKELKIFHNNKEGLLQIINPGLLPVSSVSIYDLTGKLVLKSKSPETEELISFATGHLSNSVYLVKILHQDGTVKSQKISVFNSL